MFFKSENFLYNRKNFLSIEQSNKLINFYEQNPNKIDGVVGKGVVEEKKKKCKQISVSFEKNITQSIITTLRYNLKSECKELAIKYPFLNTISGWKVDDLFNIQKYEPKEAYFEEHCEHMPDQPQRIIAWMIYLNNVNDRGGTYFPHQKITLKPKVGDLWIWPASWTHPHKGIPSPTEIKYIATGWISYT